MTLEELRAIRAKRQLTAKERELYCAYWKSSGQSKQSFCRQEG